MDVSAVSDAKRRLIELIKRRGPSTPPELAEALGLTGAAVRQHLAELQQNGLVESQRQPARGRGRPSSAWTLTAVADSLFPDRHADLTVDLIRAMRAAIGEEGLDRVVEARSKEQLAAYRRAVPNEAPLSDRVDALARMRTAEGYMAETTVDDDGAILLIEHHCPICDAAAVCAGLCRSELDVFRDVLPDAAVERTQHRLSDGTRCVYRVTPRTGARRTGC